MQVNNYETLFILTPTLDETQVKEYVNKYTKLLTQKSAEIVESNHIGMRKLAYPISGKKSGLYHFFEFKSTPGTIKDLEIEYKRDDKVIRFLTIALEKYGVAYNKEKREKLAVVDSSNKKLST